MTSPSSPTPTPTPSTSSPTPTPTTRRPIFGATLLLGAALCWGLGFYAQRVSIETVSPLWATALRFVVGSPLVLAALWWRKQAGVRIPWRAGIILGVILYISFALQTVAMLHTPVTRVALITGLYAVFVPLMQPLFGLARPTVAQLLGVGCAVVGVVLLCGVVGDARALTVPPNIGDAFTLVMAVSAAVLVLLIGRLAPTEDAVALNVVQIGAMTVCAVMCAPLFEGAPPTDVDERTWLSLLYLAVFSTFIAFLLQMLGQRHVSPASASVIMLVETPIGVLAAVAILGEALAPTQWLGAGFALVAVVVAIFAERRPVPTG